MTKREMIELLENARAVPDDARIVIEDNNSKLIDFQADDIMFVINRFGSGERV